MTASTYEHPLLQQLWENGAKNLEEKEWKIHTAWENFKADLLSKSTKKDPAILKKFRSLSNVRISVSDDNACSLVVFTANNKM